jgi:nitroreductase/predicted RNA-binding protein
MCETTIYLERDGQREKLLDDVSKIVVTADGVEVTRLFEASQTIPAVIRELDFLKHTATLVAPERTPEAPSWILKRRSIRTYTGTPVTDAEVQALLQAAMAAPSANDVRPWAFVVVRDPARRRALAETHEWSAMCADAPAVIAVLGDPAASEHWIEDCSAATENLLLAAAGCSLGAVWVAVYPQAEREAHVRQTLGIPERLRVLCLLPVGHPAEQKPPRTRYEESKVHRETYGGAQ